MFVDRASFLRPLFFIPLALFCGIFSVSFIVQTNTVLAANGINRQINYQAKLLDASGFAVTDGNYAFKFSIYDAATGGTRLWTASGTLATPTVVTSTARNGLFTILLGDTSSTGGNQNPLDIDWNNDGLYLGVTVGSDSEMTPRKRLASAPYAFNAERLQGMTASGTAFGAASLFVINQTSATAATGTRTALEVRSSGTSDANDYLIRGINDTGSEVFAINRSGNVTTTGYFTVSSTATSTFFGGVSSTRAVFDRYITVNGKSVCLSDGTNCSVGSEADTLATVTARGGSATSTVRLYGGAYVSFLNATSTFGVSSTASFQGTMILGDDSGDTITVNGRFGSDLLSDADATRSLGSISNRYLNGFFVGVSSTNATSTNATTTNLAVTGSGTSTFSGSIEAIGNVSSSRGIFSIGMSVSGQSVCLANGTNCPAASTADLNWTYSSAGEFVRNATSTTDLVFGSSATSTGAPAYFDFSGGQSGTSTFYFGHATNANVVIGGTSTTHPLNTLFRMNGDDLLVTGNIGSVSSVYTNGAFVAGSGSTYFGAAAITNTSATLTISSVSGTRFINRLDHLYASESRFSVAGSSTFETSIDIRGLSVSGRYAYTASPANAKFRVFDVQNPSSPSSTFSTTGFGSPQSVYASGRYVYETTGDNLRILDVSNPKNTSQVGSVSFGGSSLKQVVVSGRYAYTVDGIGDGRMYIVDVTNPSSPTVVTSTGGMNSPASLFVRDHYVYVADKAENELEIIDVAVPQNPVRVGQFFLGAGATPIGIWVQGKYAYVSKTTDASIDIIDISNAAAPYRVKNVSIGSNPVLFPQNIVAQGRYVYVLAQDNKIHVIDANDPVNATETMTFAMGVELRALAVSGRYLYVAFGISVPSFADGLAVIDTGGLETSALTAHTAELGGLQVLGNADIDNQLQIGGALTVGTGGIMSDGPLAVVATNTTSSFLGNVSVGTSTYSVAMHSLFTMNGDDLLVGGNIGSVSSVYTNGAFVAGSGSTFFGNGFVTKTDGTLSLMGSSGITLVNGVNNLLQTDTTLSSLSTTGNVGTAPESIAVNGRYAYVLGKGNGVGVGSVSIADVQNPSAPSVVKTVTLGGINAQDIAVKGQYAIATLTGSNAVNILDVSDPGSARVIATSTGLSSPYGIAVKGSFAYVTGNAVTTLFGIDLSDPYNVPAAFAFLSLSGAQGIAASGRYLYVAENTPKNLKIIDASVEASPTLAGTLSLSAVGSPSSLDVQGRYAYVGYTDAPKFSVVDVASSTNPFVVTTVTVSGATAVARNGIAVSGRYLRIITTGDDALHIYDISSASSPTEKNSIGLTSASNGIYVAGRYAYVGNTSGNKLEIIDQTGLETTSLIAQSAELGNIQVLTNGEIANDLTVGGTFNVGFGGILSNGPVAIYASNTRALSIDGSAQGATVVDIDASSTASGLTLQNTATNAFGQAWGAWIDQLSVGEANATGSANYSMVLSYASSATFGGLCIDDTSTANTCPTNVGASLMADGSVIANAFDLAETYAATGTVSAGDVLVLDPSASVTVMRSPGHPYDAKVVGIASAKPGFLLGWNQGIAVALSGRVPTKVSPANGEIAVGDPLTSSPYAGYAMKATKPGMIVGYALESAAATSTIEVFVKVGYDARSALSANAEGTIAQLTDDLVIMPTSTATAVRPASDSWGLTFRGEAWNGSGTVTADYTLVNDILSSTTSRFSVKNASSTALFSVDQAGTARIGGDLHVGGRLYPSARGSLQSDKYIFLDDTQSPTSSYIATNADGWQANTSYDFAERYYSPDALEPGDLVMASERGRLHVQRSMDEKQPLLGIVSTKPAFVAGAPTTSTHPIALAGRVPTKVSTLKGAILVGDPLAPSTIPGVAVKATAPGPIAGYALESYDASAIGLIEVFVNPGWWGTNEVAVLPEAAVTAPAQSHQGYAMIVSGETKVHVSFPSLHAYPNVQATPRGEVVGGWWTDRYSDIGFDIVMKQSQTHDVNFAWRVEATNDGETLFFSDGTTAKVNAMTGEAVDKTEPEATAPMEEVPIPLSATSTTETAATSTPETVSAVEPLRDAPSVIEPAPVVDDTSSSSTAS